MSLQWMLRTTELAVRNRTRNMNCIQAAINGICESLSFPIKYQLWDKEDFRWNFENETHFICHPKKERNDYWDLYMLHEHVHALHKETLPNLFSTNPPVERIPYGYDRDLFSYFNCARDWFVAAYMMDKCPNDTKSLIAKEFQEISAQSTADMSDADFLIAGLVSAQSKLHLGGECVSIEKASKVAEILMKTKPSEPTLDNLYCITKELTDLFGYFTITLTQSEGWSAEVIGTLPSSKSGGNRTASLMEKFS